MEVFGPYWASWGALVATAGSASKLFCPNAPQDSSRGRFLTTDFGRFPSTFDLLRFSLDVGVRVPFLGLGAAKNGSRINEERNCMMFSLGPIQTSCSTRAKRLRRMRNGNHETKHACLHCLHCATYDARENAWGAILLHSSLATGEVSPAATLSQAPHSRQSPSLETLSLPPDCAPFQHGSCK